MSFAYRWFGLLGIGLYGTLLTIAVAYAIYWMLRRLSGRFWIALILAAIAAWSFLFNGMPRPVFFSMVLFCVTLTLLLEANRTGGSSGSIGCHCSFAFGPTCTSSSSTDCFWSGCWSQRPSCNEWLEPLGFLPDFLLAQACRHLPLIAIFAACIVATLLGPNLYHPYVAVLRILQGEVLLQRDH